MESDNVVYSVVFARSARKELEIISHPIVVRILKKIEAPK
jgi:hypothetical protein